MKLLLCLILLFQIEAEAGRRRRSRGPTPTHPVVLWARKLSDSQDIESRRKAAFKLSQYSLNIFQEEVVHSILKCTQDKDLQLKVLCTKSLGRCNKPSQAEMIEGTLLGLFKDEPSLRPTIVRTFGMRGANSPKIHNLLLEHLGPAERELKVALLEYFEMWGSGDDAFVSALTSNYEKNNDLKLRTLTAKALGNRAKGQDPVVSLLTSCVESKETVLVLTCLSGLEQQAKKGVSVWNALEKTIQSSDSDVLIATLDVIQSLPASPNPVLTKALLELAQTNDPELQEKAILALGICADPNADFSILDGIVTNTKGEENTRIAAALVLGKQKSISKEMAQSLRNCAKADPAPSVKSACELGVQDLERGLSAQQGSK